MISVYTIRHHKAYGFYEDQYLVCNFNHTCQITNIDDMKNSTLEYNFKHNLDTFDLDQLNIIK